MAVATVRVTGVSQGQITESEIIANLTAICKTFTAAFGGVCLDSLDCVLRKPTPPKMLKSLVEFYSSVGIPGSIAETAPIEIKQLMLSQQNMGLISTHVDRDSLKLLDAVMLKNRNNILGISEDDIKTVETKISTAIATGDVKTIMEIYSDSSKTSFEYVCTDETKVLMRNDQAVLIRLMPVITLENFKILFTYFKQGYGYGSHLQTHTMDMSEILYYAYFAKYDIHNKKFDIRRPQYDEFFAQRRLWEEKQEFKANRPDIVEYLVDLYLNNLITILRFDQRYQDKPIIYSLYCQFPKLLIKQMSVKIGDVIKIFNAASAKNKRLLKHNCGLVDLSHLC